MSKADNKNNPLIMVVDDEQSIREFLEIMLSREGYNVTCCASAQKALDELKNKNFDVVITDISMPEMNGIELLTKIKQIQYGIPIILMTAFGSTERAVEAMKLGASDYLTKPFQIAEMKLAVKSALSVSKEKKWEAGKNHSIENIIGESPKIKVVFDLIQKISSTKTNIMIQGESGTGKELVAHAIHMSSAEKDRAFVAINCAAIPESLFESELFGHKKGSFTGAVQDKDGIFKQADGGTLFLDEVGDIPLSVQVKMLRAIQQKVFRAVGGLEDIQVDLRIICATNKNLEEMVQKGSFREDLFYRLNVIQIKLPTLRERKEDIPILANHFLRKFNLSMGKNVNSISQEALAYIIRYDYPGNIRELENIIERAVALENGHAISSESLPQKILMWNAPLTPKPETPDHSLSEESKPKDEAKIFDLEKGLEEFERQHIIKALNMAHGMKTKAAALLGISFRSLRYRIEKYGIDDPNPEEKE